MGKQLDPSQYLDLGWTFRSRIENDGDGTGDYTVVTVDELPGFLVAVEPSDDPKAEIRSAMECFIGAYLDRGQTPPMPGWRIGLGQQETRGTIALGQVWGTTRVAFA